MRYRAAQAGAAEAAGPPILQLQNMRAAHEAITESTRLEAQAQRQVAQAQANKDGFQSVSCASKSRYTASLRKRCCATAAWPAPQPTRSLDDPVDYPHEGSAGVATASAKAAADAQQAATQAQAKGDAFSISLRVSRWRCTVNPRRRCCAIKLRRLGQRMLPSHKSRMVPPRLRKRP